MAKIELKAILKKVRRFYRFLCLKKEIEIKVVDYNDLINMNKVYRFRYEMYCLEYAFLKKEDYKNGVEEDEFDKDAIHIVAFDKKNNVCGMLRILLASKTVLPTEKEYDLSEHVKDLKRTQFAEISRFVVLKEYKNTYLSLGIILYALKVSNKKRIKYWIGTIEEWLFNYMEKASVHPVLIGERKFVYNTWNYPFILSLFKIKDSLLKKNIITRLIIKYLDF